MQGAGKPTPSNASKINLAGQGKDSSSHVSNSNCSELKGLESCQTAEKHPSASSQCNRTEASDDALLKGLEMRGTTQQNESAGSQVDHTRASDDTGLKDLEVHKSAQLNESASSLDHRVRPSNKGAVPYLDMPKSGGINHEAAPDAEQRCAQAMGSEGDHEVPEALQSGSERRVVESFASDHRAASAGAATFAKLRGKSTGENMWTAPRSKISTVQPVRLSQK